MPPTIRPLVHLPLSAILVSSLPRRSSIPMLCAAIAATACATAPPPGAMVTDRPDFTESAATVAPGHAQLEAGYTVTAARASDVQDVGETLVRAGVTDGVELRVGLGSWRIADPAAGQATSGFAGPSLGVKIQLPASSLAPEAAVLIATSVPVGSKFDDDWTPSVVWSGAWSAAPADVGVNVGYAHMLGGDGQGEMLASAAVGLPVEGQDRLGLFLETYGFVPLGSEGPQLFVDGGFTFAVTRDVQVDVRLGRSVSGPTETAVGVGIAIRR